MPQMPSGHGEKRASFFGWLSLKGVPFPRKKNRKKGAPLGNRHHKLGQKKGSHPKWRLHIGIPRVSKDSLSGISVLGVGTSGFFVASKF